MSTQLFIPGVGSTTVLQVGVLNNVLLADLIVGARNSLSDTDVSALRWSEPRLVDLASRAQEDFNIRTKLLKDRITLTVDVALNAQTLPSDTRTLTRVLYDGEPLQILTHEQADEKLGLGWETATGAAATAIIYDRLEPNKLKVHPTLPADFDLVCYTLIKPDKLTVTGTVGDYTYSTLQIPEVYHHILEYFIVGMALRDDQDTANRALGKEHLGMYADLVVQVSADSLTKLQSVPRSAVGTNPLEVQITNVRYALGDEASADYTEERLVRLFSQAQEDFSKRTNILKLKQTITIDPNLAEQPLATNTVSISRVIYGADNKELTLISHDEADELHGISWEGAEGALVEKLIYDRLTANTLKTYPALVAPAGGFGVDDLTLYVYSVIKPAALTLAGSPGNFTYPTLQIPEAYHTLLEAYVIGMALRDVKDVDRRAQSKDSLGIYVEGVDQAMKLRSTEAVASPSTRRNTPNYNRVI